ncbi:MAG: acyl-CoA synthetase [Acetobacteraceae bacterium]|nr:acyl-CoA synthetase [Acetobacteraceae bacterium]
MYIGDHARETPDKPALINSATGAALTFAELNERSNRLAQYLYAHGLRRGDNIALFMENNLRYMEIIWAALRSGLYITAVNRYLTTDEAAYIINDCDASVLVTSAARADVAQVLPESLTRCRHFLMTDGTANGWGSYESAIADYPPECLADEWLGDIMLYSSGTTGRPKGVKRPLQDMKLHEGPFYLDYLKDYGFSRDTVYLSPAPMYHAAPLLFSLAVQHAGGAVVMMPHFDATEALAAIERYRVTHSQWVPTMFVRMQKLPEAERKRFDLSSHRCAIHAAAPCPVGVKQAMIAWWGPILYEYYGATEGNGMTRINAAEWLAHPGSVGRAAVGVLHICDENGRELPAGQPGLVYFEREKMPFVYHKDSERTRGAQHPLHPNWSTVGDLGYIDAEGFLYLTDRKAFTIISGGVNIYPREIEDALVTHPSVRDVAVFGIPDPEMGERVIAVVEPTDTAPPSEELAAELIAFLRGRIAHYKVPKSIHFTDSLPRLPTGKLYKQALRARYLPSG